MFCNECGTKITGRICPNCGHEEIKSALNDISKSSPPTSFTIEEKQEIIEKLYSNSPIDYSNLTDSDKDTLRQIFIDSYKNKTMPSQILTTIRTEIEGISPEDANKISITERMRSSNLLSYVEALTKRKSKSFIVRVNSNGCDLCHETYEGKTFDICQRNMIPPLHDECTCFPQFSRDQIKKIF